MKAVSGKTIDHRQYRNRNNNQQPLKYLQDLTSPTVYMEVTQN